MYEANNHFTLGLGISRPNIDGLRVRVKNKWPKHIFQTTDEIKELKPLDEIRCRWVMSKGPKADFYPGLEFLNLLI